MNIVVIGNVEFTLQMLETLAASDATLVGVITGRDAGINADHVDLTPFCERHDIDLLRTNDANAQETIAWVERKKPDLLFCLGWSRLINKPLLGIAPYGVIGYHPAQLPKNRGRHPLIWALALGLNETASTFFFMDEGADSGDIISQMVIKIDKDDNAKSLYQKMVEVARTQLVEIIQQIPSETFQRRAQNDNLANYWRKRSRKDGEIDWRMSAHSIHNLIRALTTPYPGAHFIWNGQEHQVWKSRLSDQQVPQNIEPGKVLSVTEKRVTVKCADHSIELLDIEPELITKEGDYL